jgi:glycosyltransferase involved in cell wall biosynthesis
MTILYHHRTLADGAEGIHIASMVEAFRWLGHTVRVTGLAAAPGATRADVFERIRTRLPGAVLEVASVAMNVPEYLQVTRHIRRRRPDMVYVRHSRFGIAALEAARHHGIPTVLEVNSLFTAEDYHRFEPLALRTVAEHVERRALECASVVLAVSTPLARQIHRFAAASIVVLPNGADPEQFDPGRADPARVRALWRLNRRLTIGWSGILREWHGVELLLEALSELPDVQLLLVGDGPARMGVERRAAALGVADRVTITGRIPHAEMPDYVAAMDIAVVADERTGVASPMKLLEYMSMGRAVIAPRMENVEDIVRHDVNGLLFTPGSASELAAALRHLAQHDTTRAALGRRARADIQRERNWRRNAMIVLGLVDPDAQGREVTVQESVQP